MKSHSEINVHFISIISRTDFLSFSFSYGFRWLKLLEVVCSHIFYSPYSLEQISLLVTEINENNLCLQRPSDGHSPLLALTFTECEPCICGIPFSYRTLFFNFKGNRISEGRQDKLKSENRCNLKFSMTGKYKQHECYTPSSVDNLKNLLAQLLTEKAKDQIVTCLLKREQRAKKIKYSYLQAAHFALLDRPVTISVNTSKKANSIQKKFISAEDM